MTMVAKRKRKTDDFGRAPDMAAAIEDLLGDLPKQVPLRPAAEVLGIAVPTLRTWIRDKRLAAIKTAPGAAGRVRVPRAELARLLRAMSTC